MLCFYILLVLSWDGRLVLLQTSPLKLCSIDCGIVFRIFPTLCS